jgi:hypothetical protein
MSTFNWGAAGGATRREMDGFRQAFQGAIHKIVALRAGYGMNWEVIGRILAERGAGPDPMLFWMEWERLAKARLLPGLDDPGVIREMDAVVDDWIAATKAE